MNISIVSCEKQLARMLELELLELHASVKTITEKLSPPALDIAVNNADLIIFDTEYYSGDISYIHQTKKPFVFITKGGILNHARESENITGIFERPFSVDAFVKHVSDQCRNSVFSSVIPNETVNIELDHFSKQAFVNGKAFKFSPKEFSLLALLYKNRGRTVARQTVLETIWGEKYDPSNNVDNVYINYLRKKLDEALGIKLIYTVRGKGYMLK